MYQLGLGAATAEVPSMSVALGANRWASRVVVVLQLAAWSAVGIVLLQKGVTSLQKTSAEVRNVTKTNYTETVANLMMKKISENSVADSSGDVADFLLPTEDKKLARNIAEYEKEDEILPKTIPAVIPITSFTTNHLSNDKKRLWNTDKNQFQDRTNQLDRNEFQSSDTLNDNNYMDDSTQSVHSASTTTEKYEKSLATRKKTRISNVNGGGGAAAAAVAMVAVGAVMLILGPIVIILRALDERRQERRFLKLSGQDDLPPSYEQATLMDEAPRYSTLSLNTIGCSPAATAAGTSFSTSGCTVSTQANNCTVHDRVGEISEV